MVQRNCRLCHSTHNGMRRLLHSLPNDAHPSREDDRTRNLGSKVTNDFDGTRRTICQRNITVNFPRVQLSSWDSYRERGNLACKSLERFDRHCTTLKNGVAKCGKLYFFILRDKKRLEDHSNFQRVILTPKLELKF